MQDSDIKLAGNFTNPAARAAAARGRATCAHGGSMMERLM